MMQTMKRSHSAFDSMQDDYFSIKKRVDVPDGKCLCIFLKTLEEDMSVVVFKATHVYGDSTIQIASVHESTQDDNIYEKVHHKVQVIHETMTNTIKKHCLKLKTCIDVDVYDNRYIIVCNNVIVAKISLNDLSQHIKLSCIEAYSWTVQQDEEILTGENILTSSDVDLMEIKEVLSCLCIHAEDLH